MIASPLACRMFAAGAVGGAGVLASHVDADALRGFCHLMIPVAAWHAWLDKRVPHGEPSPAVIALLERTFGKGRARARVARARRSARDDGESLAAAPALLSRSSSFVATGRPCHLEQTLSILRRHQAAESILFAIQRQRAQFADGPAFQLADSLPRDVPDQRPGLLQ